MKTRKTEIGTQTNTITSNFFIDQSQIQEYELRLENIECRVDHLSTDVIDIRIEVNALKDQLAIFSTYVKEGKIPSKEFDNSLLEFEELEAKAISHSEDVNDLKQHFDSKSAKDADKENLKIDANIKSSTGNQTVAKTKKLNVNSNKDRSEKVKEVPKFENKKEIAKKNQLIENSKEGQRQGRVIHPEITEVKVEFSVDRSASNSEGHRDSLPTKMRENHSVNRSEGSIERQTLLRNRAEQEEKRRGDYKKLKSYLKNNHPDTSNHAKLEYYFKNSRRRLSMKEEELLALKRAEYQKLKKESKMNGLLSHSHIGKFWPAEQTDSKDNKDFRTQEDLQTQKHNDYQDFKKTYSHISHHNESTDKSMDFHSNFNNSIHLHKEELSNQKLKEYKEFKKQNHDKARHSLSPKKEASFDIREVKKNNINKKEELMEQKKEKYQEAKKISKAHKPEHLLEEVHHKDNAKEATRLKKEEKISKKKAEYQELKQKQHNLRYDQGILSKDGLEAENRLTEASYGDKTKQLSQTFQNFGQGLFKEKKHEDYKKQIELDRSIHKVETSQKPSNEESQNVAKYKEEKEVLKNQKDQAIQTNQADYRKLKDVCRPSQTHEHIIIETLKANDNHKISPPSSSNLNKEDNAKRVKQPSSTNSGKSLTINESTSGKVQAKGAEKKSLSYKQKEDKENQAPAHSNTSYIPPKYYFDKHIEKNIEQGLSQNRHTESAHKSVAKH